MIRTLTILGTRPEAIKLAMLHKLLLESDNFDARLCLTGQHEHLVKNVLDQFALEADYTFESPVASHSLSLKISHTITALENLVQEFNPDLIIVQGDTYSSYCGSLVAFLNQIKLAHVEAGLRTYNNQAPFPEEVFRKFNDSVADFLFAPTTSAKQNLINEGFSDHQIHVTGNTSIDALLHIKDNLNIGNISPSQAIVDEVSNIKSQNYKVACLTMHRREALDSFYSETMKDIDGFAEAKNLKVLYPVHPNPNIAAKLESLELNNIIQITALAYMDFIWLLTQSVAIFSDSGGVQEEAPYLGIPLFILRKETERPEAVESHNNHFYNEDSKKSWETIISNIPESSNLFGSGHASEAIMNVLVSSLS